MDYFHRQIELWGKNVQDSLKDKKIVIVGAGGLGSSLSLALGTSGIGQIDIIDFDNVANHNIHRQIAFTLKDEGKNKASTIASLVKEKNPFIEINAFETSFEEFEKKNIKYDLILDATDNLPSREAIDNYAKKHSTPWIYASVEEFHGQVSFIEKANFKVFPKSNHTPKGITAPIVMFIGSFQANIALRYLANLPIVKEKLYYLYFNKNGEFEKKVLNMPLV